MFKIKNRDDLAVAYELLHILQDVGKGYTDRVKDLKREIRAFTNSPLLMSRIVQDNGMDGYVALIQFPGHIFTQNGAVGYFESHLYIEPTYSPYDCAGQPFTSWYKIFNRRGTFYAYHGVCFDV